MKIYNDNKLMFKSYDQVVVNNKNINRQAVIRLAEQKVQSIKGPIRISLEQQITRCKTLIDLQENGKITPEQELELQQLEEKGLLTAMGTGAGTGALLGGGLPGAIAGGALGAGGYLGGKAVGLVGKGLGKLGAGIGGMLSGKGFGAGVQQRNISKNVMPAFQKSFAAMNKLRQMGIKIPGVIDDELKKIMQQTSKQYGVQVPQG